MGHADFPLPVATTTADLRTALASARRSGVRRLVLVPTMGNLHAGHLQLMREARRQGDFVVASVFVNPLQFAEGEDFDQYPRSLAADAAKLAAEGVDLLFAPSDEQMYPHGGAAATRVTVEGLSDMLCGAYRPGHFSGITTVVSMLFNLVAPDVAVFGRKDYQQLIIIRRMVADLHWPLEVVGVPIERESDGLALSSRNQYLSDAERGRASQLYVSLQEAARRLQGGEQDYAAIEAEGVRRLEQAGFKPDYLSIRTPSLAHPSPQTREFVLLTAAWLGSARLIDNIMITRDQA